MKVRRKSTIFLIDDHRVVIEGIRRVIEQKPEFEVIGDATDGLSAVRQVKLLKPDVVVLDLSMPKFDGIETGYEILKKSGTGAKVIVYSMISDREYVIALFKAGISGYVLKEEPLEDLVRAIEAVRNGGTYYSRSMEKHLRSHMNELEQGNAGHDAESGDGVARLSFREKEIFPLLADGKSIREIADALHISPKTVESHKYNIMAKLDVASIAELTKLAIKKKLIKV